MLPLQNVGGDPRDDYFADGVVEDIVLSLANLRELFVISRGSTLAYRGKDADSRQVGRELGVRYVLRGTVDKSPGQLRISTLLCDAHNGTTVWSEQTQVAPGDLFEVQDRIVEHVVPRIAPQVRAHELRSTLRKKPENFSAYDWTLRALHVIYSLDRQTFGKAREYLENALAEDPNFAMAATWAARWHSLQIGQGWSKDVYEDTLAAIKLTSRAIELDPCDALALATTGHIRSFLFRDYDNALFAFNRALAACPNHSLAWLLSSATLSYVGRGEQAVEQAKHALRLSPLDRSIFNYYSFLLLAHYVAKNYDEAVEWGKMALDANPLYTTTHRILSAALAALGRVEQARGIARAMMKLEPNFRLGVYEEMRQPFAGVDLAAQYIKHLRRAGLPE